ncbi:glutathione S-transferase (plasmid) [Pseudorhodobacter turbinis]|uniref:Glutathione S-transferase n=1 Tax=Pseudorhodobacter turbinis TaxID=2500533 RepID=A0A4P8EI48_9RHOB|nr:glutathione S-transferase [Pseudorhodobacter turbinis]QCO56646.1 glutathione S-transferase [Pseudorhodobacter turbinis]
MTAILYSFRRCPYAIRARLALHVSGVEVEMREILLRSKPAAFLAASPSATVPCLVTDSGGIDESLDVMLWALRQNDPEGWLQMPEAGHDWIARADGPFKGALDRVKYASRHPSSDVAEARRAAVAFFDDLEMALGAWVFDRASLADYAILPFVRQFAFVDKPWFDAQPWPKVQAWLAAFLASDRFDAVMVKRPLWVEGPAPSTA